MTFDRTIDGIHVIITSGFSFVIFDFDFDFDFEIEDCKLWLDFFVDFKTFESESEPNNSFFLLSFSDFFTFLLILFDLLLNNDPEESFKPSISNNLFSFFFTDVSLFLSVVFS